MVTHMYLVTGMNCESCVSRVKSALKGSSAVIEAQVHLQAPQAIISMKEEVSVSQLQQLISAAGHYTITEITDTIAETTPPPPSKGGLDKLLGLFHHKKDCCK